TLRRGDLVGDHDLAVAHEPLEQSGDVALDDVRRGSLVAPNRHLGAQPAGATGPAHQVIRQQAELLRRFQALENSVLIRIHARNLPIGPDGNAQSSILFRAGWLPAKEVFARRRRFGRQYYLRKNGNTREASIARPVSPLTSGHASPGSAAG